MKFEVFAKRLTTIKALTDKIDKTSQCLTQAFSMDIEYDKIYADSFNTIVDRMVDDIAYEMSLEPGNDYVNSLPGTERIDYYNEMLSYIIWESEWCSKDISFSIVEEDKSLDVDNTIYNNFAYAVGFRDFDSFENPRFALI